MEYKKNKDVYKSISEINPKNYIHLPPHYDEYEDNVLGLLISDSNLTDKITSKLSFDDFYKTSNQVIYKCIQDMLKKQIPIDEVTVLEELRNTGQEEDVGGFLRLGQLVENVISHHNIDYHINKILEVSYHRKLWKSAQTLSLAIVNGEQERIEHLREQIADLKYTNSNISSRLNPISAKDLPDTPPPQSFWGGLLYPASITQLNAEPGAGKSTFMYNIAGLGAQGKEFLNIPFHKTTKTLYADLESPQWLIGHKIQLICNELPSNFDILVDLNLDRDFQDLLTLCNQNKYDLLVFDTQSKVLAMEDENSNSEACRLVYLLTKLARDTGAAIILIHHTKKNDGGMGVYRGRGASAIAGGVDIVANLKKLESDTLKLKVEKSRIPILFDSITFRKIGYDKFELIKLGTDRNLTEIDRIQSLILNIMSDFKEWQTGDILVHAIKAGFKERSTEDALRRLVESDKVHKIRHGIYILSSKSTNGFSERQIQEDFNNQRDFN